MLNEQQTAALWATAFRDLADAIGRSSLKTPQSIDIWNHDVPFDQLLSIADFTAPESFKINVHDDGKTANVRVPVGKPLGLEIEWHFIGPIDGPDALETISDHNEHCMGADAQPTEHVIATDAQA